MSENENQSGENVSLGLVSLPAGTFEHDIAVSERYQKFSTELMRLSLAAIGAVIFLIVFLVSFPKQGFRFEWLVKNTTFGVWLVISLFCFAVSFGLALLHLFLSADSKAYHLKYLRLEKILGDNSKIREIKKREDFGSCWNLYSIGKTYDESDPDRIIKQAADERDVRNFLLKISGKLVLFSGILLWLGAITLIFSLIPVIFD